MSSWIAGLSSMINTRSGDPDGPGVTMGEAVAVLSSVSTSSSSADTSQR
jgi:hypothetical protein